MLVSIGAYDFDTERDCFVCPKCGKTYEDEDDMIHHIKADH